MKRVGQLLDKYWVIYYLTFVGFSLYYLAQYWQTLPEGSIVDRTGALISVAARLADAFGASAGDFRLCPADSRGGGAHGIADSFSPSRKLKREGQLEGQLQERKSYRRRLDDALARFGVAGDDGVRQLPMTPEVVAFLNGDPGPSA